MTARERILLYIVGAMAVGGLGYVAYTGFIKPIKEENAKIEILEGQIEAQRDQLFRDSRDNLRLKELLPLSLPANRELAENEYETMLGRLLRESKISGGKYTKQTQSETDPEPDLNPAPAPGTVAPKAVKKAYTKLTYNITFDKVNLIKLTDFLTRYHKVPLMHQIVKCSIKHATTGTGTSALKLGKDERNDLTVSLVTEAILLDGAPDRKTLFSVPDIYGAAVGSVAFNALRNDTEKIRNLTPTPSENYFSLAKMGRQYDLIAARDPFHGPLPEIKPPEPKKKKEIVEVQPDPPPYDSAAFVRLTSLTVTSEGTKISAQADIVDHYYSQFYTLRFSQTGDLFEVKGSRKTRDVRTDSKTKEPIITYPEDTKHPRGNALEISNRLSTPIHSFTVYGLCGDALLLGEKEKVEAPKAGGGGRPVKGAKPPAAAPKIEVKLVATGGLFVVVPVTPTKEAAKEKYYLWSVGQPLSAAKPLNEREAKSLLEKAAAGLKDLSPPPPVLEEAPKPRSVLTEP